MLGVVARRVGDGFHSPRHRHLPTSKADFSGTVTHEGVFRERCCCSDGSVTGGRLLCEPTEARTCEDSTFVNFGEMSKFHLNLKVLITGR